MKKVIKIQLHKTIFHRHSQNPELMAEEKNEEDKVKEIEMENYLYWQGRN